VEQGGKSRDRKDRKGPRGAVIKKTCIRLQRQMKRNRLRKDQTRKTIRSLEKDALKPLRETERFRHFRKKERERAWDKKLGGGKITRYCLNHTLKKSGGRQKIAMHR